MKRIFVIVLDSFGIGYEPDADRFGDVGANTLNSVQKQKEFYCPNLAQMGLFNIDGVSGEKTASPAAAFARLRERSAGKDTTIGHFEIAGVVSEKPLPTFPNGFPQEIIEKFEKSTGRGVLCNKPFSGTEVIKVYGQEHLKTGKLIVYTSADSVFQIAAHEDVVPPELLYKYCRMAREILTGDYAVGRVIARPFTGSEGNFVRTSNRHDFSVEPPKRTMLDALSDAGLDSIAVGKIFDIYAGRGITEHTYTTGNADGMEKTAEIAKRDFHGLCFTNLVDFDMLYGHRRNAAGYAAALSEFDLWLSNFKNKLKKEDVLFITADHGCDPGFSGTDHTREYVPLIVYGEKIRPCNLSTRGSFSDVAATVCEMLEVPFCGDGKSFAKEIMI